MNKKMNTLVFMLAGTLLNILLMMAIFLLLLFGANMFLTPESAASLKLFVFLFVVVVSVAGTFFLYSKLVKWVNKKWNLEQYMHPLFGKKR